MITDEASVDGCYDCIPAPEDPEETGIEPELGCDGQLIPGTQTKLDFFQSEVTQNDLTEKDGKIVYSNIGTFKNEELDLVVTLQPGSVYDPTYGNNANGKGKDKETGEITPFGNIGLQTDKGEPKSGEGNFKFCFQDKSGVPITVDYFHWTVYDLDERGDDNKKKKVGIKEKLIMDVSQAATYQLVKDTEVKLSCEDGSDVPCPAGVRTVFHSSTAGTGDDNPTDPENLTEQQKARSVSFEFRDISCWEFTYDHYCPVDQPDYDGRYGNYNECRWYGGGNFLYAGDSPEIIEEGECMTASPTAAPLKTEEPTLAPFAEGNTEPPQTDPPTVPEVKCPEDILLKKKIGFTDYPINEAVKIVSQDESTVTVELNQAWVADAQIDSIFAYYRETLFDQHCYETKEVDAGLFDTVTIYCNVFSPKGYLEICVADGLSKEVLDVKDDAEVPKCCYPDFPPDTPVVCYSLEINCVSECIDESQQRKLRGGAA